MRMPLLLACLSLLSASCAMTGAAPGGIAAALVAPVAVGTSSSDPARLESAPRQAGVQGKQKEPWINLFAFGATRELDEVTFENDDTGFETDASNVETTRAGIGAEFGPRNVRAYAELFVETLEGTFDVALEDLDAEGIGVGVGVLGEPWIATFSESTHLILPYRLDLGLVVADDDDRAAELNLYYYDIRVDAGLGIDCYGFQPSIGVRVDLLAGGVEAQESLDDTLDAVFTGFNVGGFAGLKYKHEEFPLWFEVRGAFGDVEGVTGSLGFTL